MLVPFNTIGTLSDPFRDLFRLQNELQHSNPPERIWRPTVDLSEDDENVYLDAELPGVKGDDIHVEVNGDVLTLRATRNHTRDEEKENMRISERVYGTFERRFSLSDKVDAENITARLEDGVLHVVLKKRPELMPRKIEVEVG